MILGCHVGFNSKTQLKGSVMEAIGYGANTFMFYTGAPQNTMRSPIIDGLTLDAYNLMKECNMKLEHVICHAPYIINLANNKDIEKYDFSINFLINEVKRCEMLGVKYLVLHPGSSVGIEKEEALNNIVYALNIVLDTTDSVVVLLETMAGKGTELGSNIEEIKYIVNGINKDKLIGVCLDTCHLYDSGINIDNFDEYLDLFDREIGINKIGCIHINDSKNMLNSHKDRHENIGFGNIGFKGLLSVINNPRLAGVPKILETPYIGNYDGDKDRLYPPYKYEIDMIKKGVFDKELLDKIRMEYK